MAVVAGIRRNKRSFSSATNVRLGLVYCRTNGFRFDFSFTEAGGASLLAVTSDRSRAFFA